MLRCLRTSKKSRAKFDSVVISTVANEPRADRQDCTGRLHRWGISKSLDTQISFTDPLLGVPNCVEKKRSVFFSCRCHRRGRNQNIGAMSLGTGRRRLTREGGPFTATYLVCGSFLDNDACVTVAIGKEECQIDSTKRNMVDSHSMTLLVSRHVGCISTIK